MAGNGAREKALQFLREVPRLSKANLKVHQSVIRRVRVDIVICRRVCPKWSGSETKSRATEEEVRMVLITVSPAGTLTKTN